jgi:hypothetical protein
VIRQLHDGLLKPQEETLHPGFPGWRHVHGELDWFPTIFFPGQRLCKSVPARNADFSDALLASNFNTSINVPYGWDKNPSAGKSNFQPSPCFLSSTHEGRSPN